MILRNHVAQSHSRATLYPGYWYPSSITLVGFNIKSESPEQSRGIVKVYETFTADRFHVTSGLPLFGGLRIHSAAIANRGKRVDAPAARGSGDAHRAGAGLLGGAAAHGQALVQVQVEFGIDVDVPDLSALGTEVGHFVAPC